MRCYKYLKIGYHLGKILWAYLHPSFKTRNYLDLHLFVTFSRRIHYISLDDLLSMISIIAFFQQFQTFKYRIQSFNNIWRLIFNLLLRIYYFASLEDIILFDETSNRLKQFLHFVLSELYGIILHPLFSECLPVFN